MGEVAEERFWFLGDILQGVSVWKKWSPVGPVILLSFLKFFDCIHGVTSRI